ncbi:MAG: hypothetical protein V3V06_02500, partial [Dehalococcoidia bacterium]
MKIDAALLITSAASTGAVSNVDPAGNNVNMNVATNTISADFSGNTGAIISKVMGVINGVNKSVTTVTNTPASTHPAWSLRTAKSCVTIGTEQQFVTC